MAMSKGRFALAVVSLAVGIAALGDSQAQAPGSVNACIATVPSSGKLCTDVESCKKFCTCACNFDPSKWKPNVANDGSTTCPLAPTTGPGMLAPDSPDLQPLPSFNYITVPPGVRATQPVIEGLQRLDARLATSPNRIRYNYTVRVGNCYRPHIDDTEAECGFVLKAMRVIEKYPEKKAEWEPKLNPLNLGLAWPGATPHSAGTACDLILVDAQGRDSFDWRAGVPGTPRSSIDQRLASRMLDEEVTDPAVGALRLNYEAWHYEWGGPTGGRCKAPDCATRYYPACGKPNCK